MVVVAGGGEEWSNYGAATSLPYLLSIKRGGFEGSDRSLCFSSKVSEWVRGTQIGGRLKFNSPSASVFLCFLPRSSSSSILPCCCLFFPSFQVIMVGSAFGLVEKGRGCFGYDHWSAIPQNREGFISLVISLLCCKLSFKLITLWYSTSCIPAWFRLQDVSWPHVRRFDAVASLAWRNGRPIR